LPSTAFCYNAIQREWYRYFGGAQPKIKGSVMVDSLYKDKEVTKKKDELVVELKRKGCLNPKGNKDKIEEMCRAFNTFEKTNQGNQTWLV
jgi:hypothetical protein